MQNRSRLNILSVVTRANQDSLKTGGDVVERMKQNDTLRVDGVNCYCCSVLIKNKLNVEENKW